MNNNEYKSSFMSCNDLKMEFSKDFFEQIRKNYEKFNELYQKEVKDENNQTGVYTTEKRRKTCHN